MQSREVTIHEARLESYSWPIARVWIRCGKGVSIRSIARDLGRALGVGGMLTALQRTRVGPFTIDRAIHAESLPARIEADLITPVEGIEDAVEPAVGRCGGAPIGWWCRSAQLPPSLTVRVPARSS